MVKAREGRGQGAHAAPQSLQWSAFFAAQSIYAQPATLGLPVGRPKAGQPAEVSPHDAESRPLLMAMVIAWLMGWLLRGDGMVLAR